MKFFIIGLFIILSSIDQHALARSSDSLMIEMGASTKYDDNIFRNDRTQDSDLISKEHVSLKYDKQKSLQHINAEITLNNNHYINNDYLDFISKTYNASWLWAFTTNLTGKIYVDRDESLNNFNDTNTTEQNIRVLQNQTFSLEYKLDSRYRLISRFNRQTLSNSKTFNQVSSYSLNGFGVGIQYITPRGNSIAFVNDLRKGKFDDRVADEATLLDDGFKELESEVQIKWTISPKSNALLNTSFIKREHNNFSERDYSGFQGNVSYAWQATSKIATEAVLDSRLATFQTDIDSYTRLNALRLSAKYQISQKVNLGADLRIAERTFLGKGYQLIDSNARKDQLQTFKVGVAWQPSINSIVKISLQHEDLDSNNQFFKYSSNQFGIEANLLF